MAKLYPYIGYKSAKEALEYYETYFGAVNVFRMPVSKEQATEWQMPTEKLEDSTIHGGFTVLGTELFCSDSFAQTLESGNQVSIMLDINSEDEVAVKEADEFYQNLVDSEVVKVTMPFEEQFWGGKMGSFTDKYGVSWMLHSQPYSKLGNQ